MYICSMKNQHIDFYGCTSFYPPLYPHLRFKVYDTTKLFKFGFRNIIPCLKGLKTGWLTGEKKKMLKERKITENCL